ncbi:PaaI family thioesterase [Parabacteroides sp. FAFU027]|uniref:PaaI family thioesterase n=1 Tax=Parabacteroides sp. FAFU027 TaxID=2922715 RepID=UPI001FAFE1BA|nr:PaaI family thioesterase [Parabacteroides sp. FAFU027]
MSMLDKFKSYFKNDRFAAHNGIELVDCRPGFAKVQVLIRPHHLNAAHVVHGGMIFTLADFACGAAANAHGLVTLSISSAISNLAKGTIGKLTAEAIEISRSNKLCTYDVNVYDDFETLIANFKGTCYITKAEIDFDSPVKEKSFQPTSAEITQERD